ncbi:MAG: hypothetical protein WCQ26_13515 [Pseudanabaena sp. ELA748]
MLQVIRLHRQIVTSERALRYVQQIIGKIPAEIVAPQIRTPGTAG